MRLTPLRRAGLAASAAVAAVAVFVFATAATAQSTKPAPQSGDERAVASVDDKNVDINHKDACTVGGLTGSPIAPEKFTFTGGKDQLDLDITAVPDGVTITGVVVKGSDAYNIYFAGKLGPLPWNDLRSPQNNGGQVPQISHWYACGVTTQQSSSSVSATSSTSPSTVTWTPSSSVTTPPSSSTTSSSVVTTTTVTTTSVAAPVNDDDLASTGFGSAWLIGLGAALLAAGAAVLLVLRRRRA